MGNTQYLLLNTYSNAYSNACSKSCTNLETAYCSSSSTLIFRKSLKGVGEYTAAAICSFAYGMPYAVVDGNVYRVLSRYFGIDTPIDSTEGKKLFAALAAA